MKHCLWFEGIDEAPLPVQLQCVLHPSRNIEAKEPKAAEIGSLFLKFSKLNLHNTTPADTVSPRLISNERHCDESHRKSLTLDNAPFITWPLLVQTWLLLCGELDTVPNITDEARSQRPVSHQPTSKTA